MEHAAIQPPTRSTATLVATELAIRPLTALSEFTACVDIQRSVWGWADVDLMPVRLFVLMQHVGGVVLGAYDGDALVGFVNCAPGMHEGRPFWHSHMMGVLPAYQNHGIGTALKRAQRQQALQRGVTSIQWVFDPLDAKNAYLNIGKLGAVVRRYSVNHYGASSSPLHAGLDSDRLVAEWRLDVPIGAGVRAVRSVVVPDDIHLLRRTDPVMVRRIQLDLREQFLQHLSDGLVVVACERLPHGSEYGFGRDPFAGGRRPTGTIVAGGAWT